MGAWTFMARPPGGTPPVSADIEGAMAAQVPTSPWVDYRQPSASSRIGCGAPRVGSGMRAAQPVAVLARRGSSVSGVADGQREGVPGQQSHAGGEGAADD